MPDYQKMYAILCGAISDAIDALPAQSHDVRIEKILQTALLQTEAIYMEDTPPDPKLTPGSHGRQCIANGRHPGVECCCDECDSYQVCFPEWKADLHGK